MLPHTLLALSFSILQRLGHTYAYIQDADYESGVLGELPTREYVSTDIVSPHLNVLQWDRACEDGFYTMYTPRGDMVKEPGVSILDSRGDLVWWKGGYKQVYNLQAQEWKGKQYLTFWAGNDAVGGHGAGTYHILDSSYKEVKKMGAAKKLDADLHDFKFTNEGTALITVYQETKADLTSLGKSSKGWIWDCLIQEIRLEDQSLVFEWRASDHYDMLDTYRPIGEDGGEGRAFDYFHINSIEKDVHGHYLISSRYTHSITYIDGKTGSILWILGGKRNNFTDLSDGKATDFRYQHDARWVDANTMTLFDNAAEDGHPIGDYSRGMRLHLDFSAMTVELVTEYVNPLKIFGVSQGNMHVMSTGDVVLGYGNSPAWTQFDTNGTVLCDVHFGPGSQFGSGRIQSYRVFKYAWRGYPTTQPAVKVIHEEGNETSVYVSWNGDTEVVNWAVQQKLKKHGNWQDVAVASRTGFETRLKATDVVITEDNLRVVGTDARGNMIGLYDNSRRSISEKFWTFLTSTTDLVRQFFVIKILVALIMSLMVVFGSRELLRWRSRMTFRYKLLKPRKDSLEDYRLD